MILTVFDMVVKTLDDINADGLINDELGCACGLDDLMPYGECLGGDCYAARKGPLPLGYKEGLDEWFNPIEFDQ